MANKTAIEWTRWQTPEGEWRPGYSSNPLRAVDTETGKRGWFCVHRSPGCEHCYAETLNLRFGNGLEYTAPNVKRVDFVLDRKEIASWQRLPAGARCFVGDMTDLFQDGVTDSMIDYLFAGFAQVPHVTFQLLTKRPERLLDYLRNPQTPFRVAKATDALLPWPIPGVWIGTSVEDQRRADERIPLLLSVPAAVRFVSAEPLLGPVDLRHVQHDGEYEVDALTGDHGVYRPLRGRSDARISWVVAGGESGHGARGCDLEWIRSLIGQCRAASVPIFVKQVGSKPYFWSAGTGLERHAVALGQKIGKGGDPESWPEELRVRQFPEVGP